MSYNNMVRVYTILFYKEPTAMELNYLKDHLFDLLNESDCKYHYGQHLGSSG